MLKKKSTLFKYSIFVIALVIFVGCSSTLPEIKTIVKDEESIYESGLRINVKQIYAWVNLMPGAKARFHITGSVELLEDSEYDINNVTIKKIKIIQNNNTIYQFTPKIEETTELNKKLFLFSTVRGLLLTSALNREKAIEVELLLSDSSSEIVYLIPDVKISEVH